MKSIFKILFFALVLISFSACSKSEESEENPLTGDNNPVTADNISAKWLLSDTTNTYQSIEFNESGNYIVIMNQNIAKNAYLKSESLYFQYGVYKIGINDTIFLSDFGKIAVKKCDSTNISFALFPNSEAKGFDMAGVRSKEIAKDTNTDLLCRTWTLKEEYENEEKVESDSLDVVFYKSGTYFVYNYTDSRSGGLAEWRWETTGQRQIRYTWDGTWDGGESGVNIVVELTKTKLIIEDSREKDRIYTYILEPIDYLTPKAVQTVKTNKVKNTNFKPSLFFSGK